MTNAINGTPVPIALDSLRFLVLGKWQMAADIPGGLLMLDIPGATNKAFSYTLDPTQRYQMETIVARENMVVTTTFPPETGVIDKSPNILRNKFSGLFDQVNVYLLPPAA